MTERKAARRGERNEKKTQNRKPSRERERGARKEKRLREIDKTLDVTALPLSEVMRGERGAEGKERKMKGEKNKTGGRQVERKRITK